MAGGDMDLSTKSWWTDHYAGGRGFEWYQTFDQLEPFLRQSFIDTRSKGPKDHPSIVHLGSGVSAIPSILAGHGFARQLCIDFSDVAVDAMRQHDRGTLGVEWLVADVRALDGVVAHTSVDVALDKGTLDSMIHGSPWDPPEAVLASVDGYLRNVHQVLKHSGVFLCVSFRQPHFVRPLLQRGQMWHWTVETLGAEGSLGYFAYTLRKK